MSTIAVLIGGPSAGKRFRIKEDERYFRVPRPAKIRVTITSKEDMIETMQAMMRLEYDTYTARFMQFGPYGKREELVLFVHENMSDFDAQLELLQCYCPRTAYELQTGGN